MSDSSTYQRPLDFLSELDEKRMPYTLAHVRPEAVMIEIASPGWRWEIEFMDDGSVEVERFQSAGEIEGEEVLSELFANFDR